MLQQCVNNKVLQYAPYGNLLTPAHTKPNSLRARNTKTSASLCCEPGPNLGVSGHVMDFGKVAGVGVGNFDYLHHLLLGSGAGRWQFGCAYWTRLAGNESLSFLLTN
jgi:hypothetical protein